MRPSDFVLCLLDASRGSIQGRTLLQKRAYFVSVLMGEDESLGFTAHYYGPYSPMIDSAVTQLKSLGFIDEATVGFGTVSDEGFEVKRYDYRLTDDGRRIVEVVKKANQDEWQRISEILGRLEKAGNPNYVELSFAAKAFFVLRTKKKAMKREELIREAKSFDWKIPAASLERAVSLLEQVGLARSS